MSRKSAHEDRLWTAFQAERGGPVSLPPAALIDPPPRVDKQIVSILRAKTRSYESTYGAVADIDTQRLDQAGWGVIMPAEVSPVLRTALMPLLELRRQQAGSLYREFVGPKGFLPGDDPSRFLARQSVALGPVDPRRGVPYYLLIVGGPDQIPYGFQQILGLHYAVGRLALGAAEEYARYARSVVAAELGHVALAPRAEFFAPRAAGDEATSFSAGQIRAFAEGEGARTLASRGWKIGFHSDVQASKAELLRALAQDAPAFVAVAGHGLDLDTDPRLARARAGALVTSDWPGPSWGDLPIPPEHYLAAADIPDDAALLGSVVALLSPFGAGVDDEGARADAAFATALPQRLLGHPRGGALAVLGHTGPYSAAFSGMGRSDDHDPRPIFAEVLERLAAGRTVGDAAASTGRGYASLGTELAEELENIKYGKLADPAQLASLAYAYHALRSFVVLGDPAVRIPLAPPGRPPARPPALAEEPSSRGEPAAPAATAGDEPGPGDITPRDAVDRGPDDPSFTPVAVEDAPPPTSEPEETPEAPAGDPLPPPIQTTQSAGAVLSFGAANQVGNVQIGDYAGSNQTVYSSIGGPPALGEFGEQVLQQIGELLSSALHAASVSEVRTYVAADPAAVELTANKVDGARLIGLTRVSMESDAQLVAAADLSEAERELLALHQQTLQTVLAERTRLLEALARIAAGLGGR